MYVPRVHRMCITRTSRAHHVYTLRVHGVTSLVSVNERSSIISSCSALAGNDKKLTT